MRTVNALLVTQGGRRRALLSVDPASTDGLPVLTIDGVALAPEELPPGAYVQVGEPEIADQAAAAGYVLEPPHTVKRRSLRILGRLYGVGLLGGAAGSLFWAVRHALALDLLQALVWIGLCAFCALLGLVWWFAGDEIMLGEQAENRSRARRLRRDVRSFVRRR